MIPRYHHQGARAAIALCRVVSDPFTKSRMRSTYYFLLGPAWSCRLGQPLACSALRWMSKQNGAVPRANALLDDLFALSRVLHRTHGLLFTTAFSGPSSLHLLSSSLPLLLRFYFPRELLQEPLIRYRFCRDPIRNQQYQRCCVDTHCY